MKNSTDNLAEGAIY